MWPLLFIGSLLPIWRRAGVDRPLNAWQYVNISMSEPMKHIPVEEAIARAKQASYLKGPGHSSIAG